MHWRHAVHPRWLWLALLVAACSLLSRLASSSPTTSTVYFRQQSGGAIFAFDDRDNRQTELEASDTYARFVGLALHRRSRRLYWSDGRAVKSANVDGTGTSLVLGVLVRAVWVGANFGQTRADVLELRIKGVACESIVKWSPQRIECLVTLPERFSQQTDALVTQDDCSIRTTRGIMAGTVLNFREMIASGYLSPIVERIDLDVNFVLPHALAIDDRETEQWLYWSNSADGKIYRSSLKTSAIEVLQEKCWSVRGLALSVPDDGASSDTALFFSLESKGTISRLGLPAATVAITTPLQAQVVLQGLRSPRGLSMDAVRQILFFTEKTGRVYQARFGAKLQARKVGETLQDDASIVAPDVDVRRIATRPSITRLDGIAVDSKYLYWCETNTNVIIRAPRRTFALEILVGGSANSLLSWPRGIVLGSDDGEANELADDLFYSEYTGRISQGRAQTVIIDELHAANMQFLDHEVRQSATQEGEGHVHLYALE